MFRAWNTALQADKGLDLKSPGVNVQDFIKKYQIRFEADGSLKEVMSRDLFIALKRVSREFGVRFDMNSPRQFAQRFANDLKAICASGFDVEFSRDRKSFKRYTIRSYRSE